jgi:hypothetical protein
MNSGRCEQVPRRTRSLDGATPPTLTLPHKGGGDWFTSLFPVTNEHTVRELHANCNLTITCRHLMLVGIGDDKKSRFQPI